MNRGKEHVIRAEFVKVVREEVLSLKPGQLAKVMGVCRKTVWTWEQKGAPLLVGKALFGEVALRGKLVELSEALPSFREIVSNS